VGRQLLVKIISRHLAPNTSIVVAVVVVLQILVLFMYLVYFLTPESDAVALYYYFLFLLYTVSQKKLCQCYFLNNSVKHWPTLIIFGMQHREET